MTRWGAMVGLLAALTAAPAFAQPAPAPPPAQDPIGDLLRRADPEAPDTAAFGRRVDPDPLPPSRYVPPATRLTAPVRIEETGKNPDGPPSAADTAYDNRIRASMASATGFQGPMYGGWTLAAGDRELFVLQFSDRGGVVDGAWRDLRRPGALDASGFIDQAERAGDLLTVRFAGGAVASLRLSEGRWSGELTQGGATQAVTLRRRNP